MSLSIFGKKGPEVEIELCQPEPNKTIEVKVNQFEKVTRPLLVGERRITGKVHIDCHDESLDHQGVKIEFIGFTTLLYEGADRSDFFSSCQELCEPGVLANKNSFEFEFGNLDTIYESYSGKNVKLCYIIRVTVGKFMFPIIQEKEIWIQYYRSSPPVNPIKLEIGIQNILHLEFEFDKSKYALQDTIVAKIHFRLVRQVIINKMELSIIKRESTGSGSRMYHESDILIKTEIMDGTPVKGEIIPVRLFLSDLDVTPTFDNANGAFSVKYYLNLVLIDTEDKKYFKQHEIGLWRSETKIRNDFSFSGKRL